MNGKGIKVKEANKWVRGVVGLLSCPIIESSFNILHLFVVYYTNNKFGLLKVKQIYIYIYMIAFILCINIFGENKGDPRLACRFRAGRWNRGDDRQMGLRGPLHAFHFSPFFTYPAIPIPRRLFCVTSPAEKLKFHIFFFTFYCFSIKEKVNFLLSLVWLVLSWMFSKLMCCGS